MTELTKNEINFCSTCGHPNKEKGEFCSSCGANLKLDSLPLEKKKVGINFFAIFVGWLVAEITGYVSSSIILNLNITLPGLQTLDVLFLLGNPLALMAGGFVAAKIAGVNHRIHGVLVTFLSILLTLFFSKVQNAFLPAIGYLFLSYSLSLLAAIIGAGVAMPAKKN